MTFTNNNIQRIPVVNICLLFLSTWKPALDIDITHLLTHKVSFIKFDISCVPNNDSQLVSVQTFKKLYSQLNNQFTERNTRYNLCVKTSYDKTQTYFLGTLAEISTGGPGSPRLVGNTSTQHCSLPCHTK